MQYLNGLPYFKLGCYINFNISCDVEAKFAIQLGRHFVEHIQYYLYYVYKLTVT